MQSLEESGSILYINPEITSAPLVRMLDLN